MRRVLLLMALAGCGDDVAVDLTIDADPCTIDLTDRLLVRVLSEAGTEVERFDVDDITFPTGVRLLSSDPERGWQVEVTALTAEGIAVSVQRARGDFEGEVLSRAVLLDDRCLGIECARGTCIAGRCDEVTLPAVVPNARPAVCPGLAFANAAAGSAAPCGSVESPCARAQTALDTLDATGGVLFLHGASPFTDEDRGSVLDVTRSNIVIRPWPDTGMPVIDGVGTEQAIDVGAADVTVDGLDVRNAARHGISINGSANIRVTVRNCVIHSNGDSESMFDNHAGVMLNNDAREVLVEDNVLRDNVTAFDRRCSGIHANQSAAVIRNNTIHGNSRNGVYTNNGAIDVIDNVIFDNGSTGLVFDSDGDVRLNRICGSTAHGIVVSSDATISMNTIVDNAGAAIRFTDPDRFFVTLNIFAFNGVGLESNGMGDPMDGPNLYFGNDARFVDVVPDAPELDIIADPLFVQRDDCSLELQPDSPAIALDTFGAR